MKARFAVLLAALFFAVGMTSAQEATPEVTSTETLTVVGHDSFAYSESVMADFTAQTGIDVQVLRSGDAGAMVNQAILSRGAPLGDVMYGVDNTFLSRALDADLFESYASPALTGIPDEFQVDSEHRVTPVDYGDVCLNYDIGYFKDHNLDVPQSLEDLADPRYKDLLVTENPATSSPGLAFLLATVAHFGDSGDSTYLNYWQDLVNNGALVVDDWNTAYYNEFTLGGGDGTYPLVVSYASSPPFTISADGGEPTTGSIVADDMCFRQIEFVGILQGTQHLQAAQKFVDFMLSREFQEDMPMQMYVFPVNPVAQLPEDFTKFAAIPEHPVRMDFQTIGEKRDQWIQDWTETVLR